MLHAGHRIFLRPLISRTYSSIGDGCPERKSKTTLSGTLECLRNVWMEKRIMTLGPSLAECGVRKAEVADNVRMTFLQRCQGPDVVSLKLPSFPPFIPRTRLPVNQKKERKDHASDWNA
jgi:hypothetical protein